MGTAAKLAIRVARSCALMIAGCACLASPSLAAGAPAPVWSIVVSAYPTQFVTGMTGREGRPPGYLLLVTNSGGAATSGEFTITDSLPARLGFATATGASGTYGRQHTELTCGVVSRTVSCSGAGPLQPGDTAWVEVPVNVKPGSSSAVLNKASVFGGGSLPVAVGTATPVRGEAPPFGFLAGASGFSGAISEADGSPATLAGSHPYQFRADINFPTEMFGNELLAVGGGVRDLSFALPPGFVVDPSAVPERCTESALDAEECPAAAQVGTAVVVASTSEAAPSVEGTTALYLIAPPPGVAVEFGLIAASREVPLHLLGRLRNDGSYGLSADIKDISARGPLFGAEVTLWGEPSDASHDSVRGSCIDIGGACPVPRTNAAFLTLPGSCGTPLQTMASVDSWVESGVFSTREIESPALSGCNALAFAPTLAARPTTAVSDSPTGFDVDLHLPQTDDYASLAEANVKDARLTLPEGVTINPSGASGLGACSASQADSASCPDDAKVGTAEVETPILGRPLTGSVYLAKPAENPFDALLAAYVAIDDPTTGIVVKLAARLDADPSTGRLTLDLEDLPQLPIEDVRLELFPGPRAILKTPIGCGTHTTASELTPWSSPEGEEATPTDSFRTSVAISGGACPVDEGDAPSAATYRAGSVVAQAGAFSPFVLQLSREDGTQRLARFDTTLPAGVIAKLTGVPTCLDAEVAADLCPAVSRVGTVSLTTGAGPNPLPLTGAVYLAGPYKGAPVSLAIAVPAHAGPFDLGIVPVRVALYLDPRSAQVHAVSDQLPTILRGIPLDIRELRLDLDRADFVRNPTSCEPMAADGSLTTATAKTVKVHSRFQVGGCPALGFRPQLQLRLAGPTHRGAHPSLQALLRPRPGDSDLRRVTVTLPAAELLDSRHIRGVCGRDEYAAGDCPPSSVYGRAEVRSPLLNRPLSGPVYLRGSSRKLPDLVASLDGEVHADLIGHLGSRQGRMRVGFDSLPDVPLSKVSLWLEGGRRGLLANSGSLCRGGRRAKVGMGAQNGKLASLRPRVQTSCGRARSGEG